MLFLSQYQGGGGLAVEVLTSMINLSEVHYG
jgi:hypothetical protein